MSRHSTTSKDFDTSAPPTHHNVDAELRELGFRIHSRPSPKGGEPVWERGGILFTQSRAVKELKRGE